MSIIYRYGANEGREYTAGESAVAAGVAVQLSDGRPAITKAALAAGQKGSVHIDGVFDVDAATATTFTVGVDLDYDETLGTAVADGTGDFHLGTALLAKANGDTFVRVDLGVTAAAGS